MQTISITDYAHWREIVRGLIHSEISPQHVQLLEANGQQSLFGDADLPSPTAAQTRSTTFRVPPKFLSLAETIACHRSGSRWNLLYRTLWRILHEHRSLLEIETDDDVLQLTKMEKQIRRDAHKMKAFVRFRRVEQGGEEFFIAWHQPDHRILRRVAPFFSRRFKGMNWTILTPDESVSWDQTSLTWGQGVPRHEAPAFDQLEDLWRTYYANIFNPARVKVKMMKSEMPVRFWKTLPEAEIIAALLADAPRRVDEMVDKHEGFAETAADLITARLTPPLTLSALRELARECTACSLHCDATQTVFGIGPEQARIVLLGEQPGDQEDLAGKSFVGPAGELLQEAAEAAGLRLSECYVTNVVKHFKFKLTEAPALGRQPRGKRRLHQKPDAREIRACRPWFEAELSCLPEAQVLICLGATALNAVAGPGTRIHDRRGRIFSTRHSQQTIATWHPAAILRSPDTIRDTKRQQLIDDLKLAVDIVFA